MFSRMLITTDFSEISRSAVGTAIQLARLCSAQVELIHVISDLKETLREALLTPGARMKLDAEIEANLDLTLPDEAYPGAKKTLIWGRSIPAEILKHAIDGKFELVICGTHARGLLGRTLLGSVTQEIIRNSPVPVLVIPKHDQARFGKRPDKILVPLDFSVSSFDAMDHALKIAEFFHSSVVLFHSIYIPYSDTLDLYPKLLIDLRSTGEMKHDAVERMKRVIDSRKPRVSVTTELAYGDAPMEIARCAEELECSLIVMGTHGRKGLGRAVLGSVTTSVLARTRIPVITVASRF